MTGLTWLPADEGFHVVRQSATADVFIQHLTQTEDVNEEMTENELAAFADWCQPTLSPQTEASTVEVTQVENLLSVTKALRTPHPPVQKTRTDDKVALSGQWVISKKYMEECVDMLASQMLAVWEVDDEDEWAPSMGDKQDDSLVEQDPSEKVLNWLDKADNEDETAVAEDTNAEMTNAFGPGVLFQKGKVTSTPFPLPASPVPSDYGIRTTPPLQHSLGTHHTPLRSLPSSSDSNQSRRKRRKLLDETPTKLHHKPPTSTKKLQESAKKKYIPGF